MENNSLFLIQSKHMHDYGEMRETAAQYIPLGLEYISAYVKKKGYSVRLFDPNFQRINLEDIAISVARETPLLVGISFMTPSYYYAKELCETIKKHSPNTPIVLGGVHPSALVRKTLQEIPTADYIIFGEGEETTLELLESISGKGASNQLNEIRGLAWRNENSIIQNPARPLIKDLDALPFPDRTLIDRTLYRTRSFLSYSNKTGSIHTARGCPGRCIFCASGHKLKARLRYRSIANVMEEIDILVNEYDVEYLLIKDDTFTWKKSRVEEFCDELKTRHPSLKWHCMGRVDSVDYDLLKKMKEAGLNDIFFGIESGNKDVLKKSQKGITLEQARKAVEACAKLKISSYGGFIIGLPGDTRETIEQTIQFATSLPLTMAGFSIMIPYPGTKAYEDYYIAEQNGSVDYRKFMTGTHVDFVEGYTGLEGIAVSELPDIVSNANERFYFRLIQIIRIIRVASPHELLGYLRGVFAFIRKEFRLRILHNKRKLF